MRSLLFLVVSLLLLPVASARGWTELDGVIYEEEKYSDGDSFRARRNRSRYIFRLYFVDTPETDIRFPDRVQEQADYLGVEFEQAVEGGEEAANWLHDLLAEQESLTVYTRYADARGASDRKRYYAMVKIGDRWLSELLVENGYARVFGVDSELPDGTSARIYWSRLRKLEKEAKAAQRGMWATSAALANAPRTINLKRPTSVFHADPPHALVGQLPAGWEVTVGAETRPGFRKVSFTSPGGNEFQGEIQDTHVGK
jgi:endonuclease YncB( thermonuclease family)